MNESTLNRMIREHKARIIWFLVFLILAVFVTALVFGTLKRSVQAQTYTKRVFACSYAQEGAEPVAHQHNDDCYENGELICTLPERELHIHGDECYAEEKVLVCTLEEGEGHVHTDACYTEEPVLVCGLEENNGHVHSVEAGCYTRVQGDLICTNEDPEHVHTDDCYAWEEVLTCEIPEGEGAHHHSEECYETQLVLSCGKEEGEGAHTHDDTCYEIQKVLICDKEEVKTEHVHTVDCFQVVDMSPEEIHALHMSELPESDPTADVESPDVWESRFASVPLSGHWDRDLLKIAETQLGYTESQRNFDAVLDENGEGYTLKGWTRYGAWYGIPYGDWCAMFISFCLNYADIPESAVPYDCATTTWIDSLSARGMYAPAGSYDPKPGDLIFFDWEGDGRSDHVGIVWAVNPSSITTIEGNHTISVELFDYDRYDGHIQGYGILPENPALAVTDSEENENGSGDNENQDKPEGGAASDAETPDSADTTGINNSSVDIEDTDKTEPETETLVKMPPFSYSERVAGMRVSIEADEGAFPEGTTVTIKPIEEDGLAEQVAPAISGQVVKVQAVDITFYDADGNEIEPRIPIRVTMRPFNEPEADKVGVVHVDNDGVVSAVETQNDVAQPDQGIAFSADSFSTYALVYTVTFAYDGEGNVYQYSMPGGTGLSLRELLIDLGMKTEDNVDSYLSHVVNVDFSKPDCMTLTKEGNDWLLQSVHAFDTAESLTVTFDDYSMLAIPVTVSGIEELQLENASISSADGVFLPEGTEGYANVVEDTAETISAVEDYVEKNTPEPTLLQQLFSFGSKADENKDGGDKAYQVFDIGLDNVDTDSFKDGFNVEVKLPENVIGRDFHLYHIHDNNVEEIDLKLASTKVETGSDLVTGFSFQTDSFSTFTLSYTVDFHYKGVVHSIPGNTQILLTQLIEIMHITVPDNAKAPENDENLDNAEAPENDENLDNAKAPENEALLDVHDVASVEFTDTHLVQVDQVSGLITINGADGKLTDVDAGDYNFLLSSLEPFSTNEKLTITLKDGNVIEVGVTDDQFMTVTISFFESDGVTPATADMSPYKYLMSGNENGTPMRVNKLVSWECSGNKATASVAIRPGSSYPWSPKDELYLVTYTDDGELTREDASDTWYNDLQNGWTKIKLGDSFELPLYIVTKVSEGQYKAVTKAVYTVNLEFMEHDYNGTTNPDTAHVTPGTTDGARAINEYSFVRVLMRNDEDDVVGYAIAPISTSEAVNSTILDQFTMFNGGTMSYSAAKAAGYSVPSEGGNVRIGHKEQNQTPSYNDFDVNTNGLSTGDYDGYTFAGQIRVSDDERTVRNRIADPAEYYVEINCGNDPLTLPSDVDVYALVKATTSTTTLYAYAQVNAADTTDGGKTYRVLVPENLWFQQVRDSISNQQIYQPISNQISGHESNVTVSLAAVAAGTTVSDPSVLMYNQVPVAGYVQLHVVDSYPSINNGNLSDPTQRTYDNKPGVKSTYTDYVYLEKNENEDRFNLYTLEKILNGGYNVVTLCPGENGSMPKVVTEAERLSPEQVGPGDAYIACHQMGGLLIRGDVTFSSGTSGVADSPNADNPSVVGGYFGDTSRKGCFINARTNNNDSVNFYLGSSNSLITVNNGYTMVNGKVYGQRFADNHGINYPGNTYINDQFVDWNRLQNAMINSSKALLDDATDTIQVVYNHQTVTVQLGSNVIISCPDDVFFTVDIVGEGADAPDARGTVINFTNSNNASVPKLKVNGKDLSTTETGEGISVVWNYPNANGTVSVPNAATPEFGHVLAPKALISISTGNYSGTLVGNNVYLGDAEGHLYPYHGGQLVGFQAEIDTEKLVDGQEPLPIQQFEFDLYQLRNEIDSQEMAELSNKYGDDNNAIFWERIQTTRNVGSSIAFKDVNFYKEGMYYFIVCENQASVPDSMNGDPTRYLLVCNVGSRQSGDDTILEMVGDIKHYEVKDYNNLITVTDIDDGKKAEINDDSVELIANLTFSDSEGKINTPIQFLNEEKNGISAKTHIEGKKVFTDGTIAANQFSFTLSGDEDRGDEDHLPDPATVYCDTEGNITFGDMTYDLNDLEDVAEVNGKKTKVYTYTLTEVLPEGVTEQSPVKDSIRYDTHIETINVTVVYDTATHEMTATPDKLKANVKFTNTFDETYLDVEKKWSVDGVVTAGPGEGINEISFYLYRKAKGVEGIVEIIDSDTMTGMTVKEDAQPFKISSDNEWKKHIDGLKKTDDNGNDYTYWITEDQVDGYSVAITMVKDDETVNVGPGTGCEQAPAESTITITNSKYSISLPETGGPGTALYGLLGGLMVVTAGAVLTLRKKKNKA